MLDSDRFWFVAPGLVMPEAAIMVVLRVERLGHRLVIDGDDVLIERGRGAPPLEADDIEALRKWKAHVWLLVARCTSDERPTAAPLAMERGAA